MPGGNPLVDFVTDKYYAGDQSKLDTVKEQLYSDPKEFDSSLQEGYNHLKSKGLTSAATYGEFRDTFVKQFGGPVVVKKKDEAQSQNQQAGTDLFDNAKQLFGPSDQQNNSADQTFENYNKLSTTFAPDLKQDPEDVNLNANLSPTEFPTENQKEQDSFKPDFVTESTQTPLNQAADVAEQNGSVLPLNSLTTGDAEVKKEADNAAIIKNKTDQMNGYQSTMYYLNDFGGRVNKRLLETPASLLDFVARTAYDLDRTTGTNPNKPYEDYVTGQWADQYRETLDKYLGGGIAFESTDTGGRKELDDHIQSQIAPAVADLLTVLAGGGAGSAGTKMLTQSALRNPNVTIGALKELGTYVATPGAFVSGVQVFNSEYEQAYNTLRQNGADEETARNEAWNSGMRNAIISAPLEALPAGKFFDRLDQLSGGGFKTRLTSMMVNGVKGFTEEAATEVAQQFFSNVDASLAYDETRQWTDGLIEAGVIGGLLGGTLNGITTGLTYRRDNAKTPEERKQYQKAIDHVVEKSQEIETVKSENESLKNAAQIQNIDNGITEILDKKENISNDEIQQLEMLELQKQDINKPMMDDLSRKTSGIDAKIKDLILQRELIYSSAMTGTQIQQASVKEKEIGQELIGLYKEKYNIRKKILAKQYINQAQEKISNLNIQEDATRRREEAGSNPAEHIGTNQQLQEEGGNREQPPQIEGSGSEASGSNSLQQSQRRQEAPVVKREEAIRKTALTVQESDFIADETKAKVLSNAAYPVKSLAVTEKEADDLLKEHIDKGDDAVLNYVLRTPQDLKPDVKVGIAAAGLRYFAQKSKEAKKVGDEGLVDKYAQTQYEIIDKAISEQATDYGRASNAIKLIKQASPEVQVISTKKAIDKIRNDYKTKNKNKFGTTASELNDINKTVSKETKKDKRIQDKLNKIKEGNTSKEKAKKYNIKKEKIQQAKHDAKAELDKLFKELGSRASSGVDPQLAAKIVAQGAKYGYYLAVEGYYDFKEWSAKMKADLGDKSEEYLDDIWKAQHEGEKISQVAKQVKEHEVRFNTEKAVKENLDDKFDKIVEKHFSEVEKTKSDLVKKLTDDLDIPESDAKELAKLVEDTFDKLSTEKKLAILKKKAGVQGKVYPKRLKQIYEKVIKLSNVGSVDENQLADIYADEFSTKELTQIQTKELRRLAEKIQTAPEGFQKQNAVQDLYKYQDSIKGIGWADIATSVWYANVLSGYKTHGTNSFANLVTTLSELKVAMTKNPKNTKYLVAGLLKGYYKGLLDASHTLKTGYSPVKSSKVETLNALENLDTKNPLSYGKYVSRLMSAADAIAYSGNKEMRAYEMAAELARENNKRFPDAKMWEKVSEILNNTEEKKKIAEAQAKEEGLSGRKYKQRVLEIMEQERSQDIIEDSSAFALRATFNGPSEGTLGLITDAVAGIVEKVGFKGVKPLKFVVPFTRIISNVANSSLEWTPWGYKRAIFGTGTLDLTESKKYSREYSADEKKKATIKATAGVLSMMAAFALSDPEDGVIEITSDGTGDIKKNYDLAKNGWQKYSIKVGDKWISYINTPFAIPFAIIGNLRDDEKYRGKSLDDKSTAEKLFMSTMNGIQFVTDMTFLKGMSDFTSIFSADNPAESQAEVAKLFTSSLKGYLVPNLYTQVAKQVMESNDIPMKQVDHWWEQLYRDIPVDYIGIKSGMYDMIDGLGDPIIPDTDKFISKNKIEDPNTAAVWDVIIKNKAWVGKVSKAQLQSNLNDIGWKGEVTDEQYYKYCKTRGQIIKEDILKNMKVLNEMKPDDVKDVIDKYKREATKGAKYQIFNLD